MLVWGELGKFEYKWNLGYHRIIVSFLRCVNGERECYFSKDMNTEVFMSEVIIYNLLQMIEQKPKTHTYIHTK